MRIQVHLIHSRKSSIMIKKILIFIKTLKIRKILYFMYILDGLLNFHCHAHF